ncbi:D-hexose-6-phosphate mutarotase [Brachybacterium sp. EF45031]|uniref:D-hexose-6-phosphate mutarotase n=1 Tax=Brachybacterium sillae TaxID=2810536 RepID=UPI00217D75CB|nr:D-hexose-6-phosphate mutarotase [Brachybacterium sillae]MCS6710505.1 D-hexose-6-phosphate mutarotase [Brachybacterium sillae]
MSTASAAPAELPLPPSVHREDRDDAPILRIDTPAASAVVHLDGAQISSWVPQGARDVLWTSPTSLAGPGRSLRGGIPLIGPWFGPGRDGRTTPKHGWLRTHRWELREAEEIAGGGVQLRLVLDSADPSGSGITAAVEFHIGADLAVDLTVTAGSTPLELETALHTYLAVGDVRKIAVEGLGGASYLDNTRDLARLRQDEPTLRLEGPTDRVYEASGPVEVHDPLLGRTLRAHSRASSRTVVWNPWAEGAAAMVDVPPDAWTDFVCVETAVAKDGFVALAPGASHTLGATYEVIAD